MNILSSSTIVGRIPYEMLFCWVPTLTHLRLIGCNCYASVFPKGDKFLERDRPAILMGYSDTQMGYMLMNVHTKKFFVNRNVTFQAHIFSFVQSQTHIQSTMPPRPPIKDNSIIIQNYCVEYKTVDMLLHEVPPH